jgi:hypothetical protein
VVYFDGQHLGADSSDELERFAHRLGLKPSWKHRDHYDVLSPRLKAKAVALGAEQKTPQELVRILRPRI